MARSGAEPTALLTGHLDPLKLWKALFFALWMCDRPLPQQRLCVELADLLFSRGMAPWLARRNGDDDGRAGEAETDAAVAWLGAFWTTVAREWTTGIDVYRMDKFLLLVRRVHAASLRWVVVARQRMGADRGGEIETRMREEVWGVWPFDLSGNLSKMPIGLRLHLTDVWVDELVRVGLVQTPKTAQDEEGRESGENGIDEEDQDEQDGDQGSGNGDKKVRWEPWMVETVAWMRERVEEMAKRSASKAVRQRAQDSLDDERLASVPTQDAPMVDADDNESWNGFDD